MFYCYLDEFIYIYIYFLCVYISLNLYDYRLRFVEYARGRKRFSARNGLLKAPPIESNEPAEDLDGEPIGPC